MAKYSFHIHYSDVIVRDEQGQDLPDDQSAQREAIVRAKYLVKWALEERQSLSDWYIQIVNADHEVVGTAQIQDVSLN